MYVFCVWAIKFRIRIRIRIPILLVHDYLFDDQTSLEYICEGFQVFLLYIRGKSYGPSILKDVHKNTRYLVACISYFLLVILKQETTNIFEKQPSTLLLKGP